jgi:Ca2+/Na+ antiporter
MPHELSWGDVYFSPFLLVLLLAVTATWITVIVLNKTRLSRFITFPSLTFIAIMVFYVVAIDSFYIQF